MSGRTRPCWLCVAFACVTAACGDEVELPTPPLAEETTAIAASYEMPLGSVDVEEAQATAERVADRVAELDLDGLAAQVSDALVGLWQRFDAGGLPADPEAPEDSDRAEMRAVVRLTRACRGFGDEAGAPDPTENGTLELTAVVDEQLNRQLWGTATRCRTRLEPIDTAASYEPVDTLLDGTIIVELYGPLPRSAGEASFLFRFTGDLGRPSELHHVELDFRIIDRTLEFRVPVADGDIIAGISPTALTLRGRNATVTCGYMPVSCN